MYGVQKWRDPLENQGSEGGVCDWNGWNTCRLLFLPGLRTANIYSWVPPDTCYCCIHSVSWINIHMALAIEMASIGILVTLTCPRWRMTVTIDPWRKPTWQSRIPKYHRCDLYHIIYYIIYYNIYIYYYNIYIYIYYYIIYIYIYYYNIYI